MVRPLMIRMRRSPVKWLFPLLVAWLFWMDNELRRSGFPLWSEVAPSFLYSVLVFGPIAAAFAGLRAWAERKPSLSELTGTAVRDPAATQFVAAAGDVGWISAAQILVVAVTMVRVALGASWGGPDWGMLLAAIAALWACAAVGWTLAWLVPTRVTGPLAGLALYFVMGVALSLDFEVFGSILALVPSGAPEGLRPAESIGDWVGWLQFAWFGAAAILAFGVAVAAARRHLPKSLLGVGVVAALAAVALLQAPGRHVEPEAPLVCDKGAIEVCAHPAYRGHLGEMADTISATVGPLVDAGVVPSRVVEDDYLDEDADPSAIGFWPYPDLAFVAEDVAQSALGDAYCYSEGPDATDAWDFMVRWLVIQGGLKPPIHVSPAPADPPLFNGPAQEAAYRRFEALGPDSQVNWLEENYERLVACELGVAEIG